MKTTYLSFKEHFNKFGIYVGKGLGGHLYLDINFFKFRWQLKIKEC